MNKETLCWCCRNACGHCCWTNGSFTPVKGWNATPTVLKMSGRLIDSYTVHKCPLYEFQSIYVSGPQLLKLIQLKVYRKNAIVYERAVKIFKDKFKAYEITMIKGISRSYFVITKKRLKR